jgi:hypothetical protein
MKDNGVRSSKKIATKSSKVLKDNKSSKDSKSLAASNLVNRKKKT